MTVLIGVVGGYGAVGRHAVRLLCGAGLCVRIGGRDLPRAEREAAAQGGGRASARRVDCDAEPSLRAFCSECRVVLNCAGPSERIVDRVAQAAWSAGADYVDVYGTQRAFERLHGSGQARGRRALLACGEMPGLSGLLPRWLAAQGFDRIERLVAHVGGLEPMSPAAALDFLLGADADLGRASSGIAAGRRAPRSLAPRTGVELPFFPPGVTAYPFLSHEAERLASALSLRELRWYNVFDGSRGLAALTLCRQRLLEGAPPETVAAELCAASQLDLFGRTSYQVLSFELEGEANGLPFARSLVVRAPFGAALSAWFANFAVLAILDQSAPPGVHYAAEALAADRVVAQLRAASEVSAFECLAGLASDALQEGAL